MLLTRVLQHLAPATIAAYRRAWRIGHVQPAAGFIAKEYVANIQSTCRVPKTEYSDLFRLENSFSCRYLFGRHHLSTIKSDDIKK
jgi:hypothetical protein